MIIYRQSLFARRDYAGLSPEEAKYVKQERKELAGRIRDLRSNLLSPKADKEKINRRINKLLGYKENFLEEARSIKENPYLEKKIIRENSLKVHGKLPEEVRAERLAARGEKPSKSGLYAPKESTEDLFAKRFKNLTPDHQHQLEISRARRTLSGKELRDGLYNINKKYEPKLDFTNARSHKAYYDAANDIYNFDKKLKKKSAYVQSRRGKNVRIGTKPTAPIVSQPTPNLPSTLVSTPKNNTTTINRNTMINNNPIVSNSSTAKPSNTAANPRNNSSSPGFLKRNKKALLIGGGLAALGGAGLYGYKKYKDSKKK